MGDAMRGFSLLGLLLAVATHGENPHSISALPNRTGTTQDADDTIRMVADEEMLAAIAAEKAGLLKPQNATRVLPKPSNVALGPYDSSLGLVLDATMKGMALATMTMAREEAFPGAFKEQDYDREWLERQHREAVRDGKVNESVPLANPYRKQKPADADIADPVLFNSSDTCKFCMFSMLSLQKMYIEKERRLEELVTNAVAS